MSDDGQVYFIFGEWEALPDRTDKDDKPIMLTKGMWKRIRVSKQLVYYILIEDRDNAKHNK